MTRSEAVKIKSKEELADFLCGIVSECDDGCKSCIATDQCYVGHCGFLDWLEEEDDE